MLSLHCSENIYVTTVHPILSFCSHFLGCGTFEVRRILKGELSMSRGDRASYLTSFGLVCLRFHCSHVVSALFLKYMSLLYSQLSSFVDTSLNVEHLKLGAFSGLLRRSSLLSEIVGQTLLQTPLVSAGRWSTLRCRSGAGRSPARGTVRSIGGTTPTT